MKKFIQVILMLSSIDSFAQTDNTCILSMNRVLDSFYMIPVGRVECSDGRDYPIQLLDDFCQSDLIIDTIQKVISKPTKNYRFLPQDCTIESNPLISRDERYQYLAVNGDSVCTAATYHEPIKFIDEVKGLILNLKKLNVCR